ncbi:MAG: SDR family oxidoreductase [Pseudomonadota bacterium]
MNAPIKTPIATSFHHRYGPWAVVTGASDGIGREMARAIAKQGVNVVLVARREDRLNALAEDIAANHAVGTKVIAADLSGAAGIAHVLDGIVHLDVGLLAACAGYGTSGPFLQTDAAAELDMLDVNCRAVLALTKPLAARMAERRRGGIILMSSIVAFQGVARAANYAATKAYVQVLAEGLREELRPFGVDVLAVAPGPVETGFGERADMQLGNAENPRTVAIQSLKALGRRTTVRPGFLAKALEAALSPLPRFARVKIMARVMGGMTKHQNGKSR